MNKVSKLIILSAVFLLFSCSHRPALNLPQSIDRIDILSERPLFKTTAGAVQLGGLSDLVFSAAESSNETLIFYSITDRGPNGKEQGTKKKPQRVFLYADYTPQILKISYSKKTNSAQLLQTILITKKGDKISGLPNVDPNMTDQYFDETPVDENQKVLKVNPWGLDPEGLARDEDGHFWVSEEYGPSILKLKSSGEIIQRWYPKELKERNLRGGVGSLPAFLAERKLNRGFEALVWTRQKTLLAFLQSEIPSQSRSDVSPIIEFDPSTQKVIGVYLYPLSIYGGKIGAATISDSGQILVLEQNGKVEKKSWQKVFAIDLAKATNLANESLNSDAQWKIPSAAKTVKKIDYANLTASSLSSYEKLEGLSALPGNELVIVNDNDFGLGDAAPEFSRNYLFIIKGLNK